MRARALNDFLVGFDQGIGFARERSDLFRKSPVEPLGASGANSCQSVGNAFERRETEPNLKYGRKQQAPQRVLKR